LKRDQNDGLLLRIIVFGMVLFYHEYFEYEISNLTSDLHCNHTNDRETVFHRCESSNVRSSCPIAGPEVAHIAGEGFFHMLKQFHEFFSNKLSTFPFPVKE